MTARTKVWLECRVLQLEEQLQAARREITELRNQVRDLECGAEFRRLERERDEAIDAKERAEDAYEALEGSVVLNLGPRPSIMDIMALEISAGCGELELI